MAVHFYTHSPFYRYTYGHNKLPPLRVKNFLPGVTWISPYKITAVPSHPCPSAAAGALESPILNTTLKALRKYFFCLSGQWFLAIYLYYNVSCKQEKTQQQSRKTERAPLSHIFYPLIHSKRPGIPSAWSLCNCCYSEIL